MYSYEGPTTAAAQSASQKLADQPGSTETATFSNGCYWGTEHVFTQHFKDKLKTICVGFIGGKDPNPSYRAVCSGRTGYAESCQMTFDPSVISYAELCEFNFRMHDPTTLNYQGPDHGTHYRSAVWYHSPEQESVGKAIVEELQKTRFDPKVKTIKTTFEDANQYTWWDAEKYHQRYSELNPFGYECPTHRLHW